jgi:hypothetical protein
MKKVNTQFFHLEKLSKNNYKADIFTFFRLGSLLTGAIKKLQRGSNFETLTIVKRAEISSLS